MTTEHTATITDKSKMAIDNPKYFFLRAFRPFSYSVAIVTTGLGILLAHKLTSLSLMPNSIILIAAALFLQAGVNFINDYADLSTPKIAETLSITDIARIKFNNRIGWICMIIAAIFGLVLVYTAGYFLLVLALFGGLGAIFYTTEPIHYKRRGLGVVLVFFYMGVLMVYGSWYALTAQHNLTILLYSLSVSCLTSALLLANELRDYRSDQKEHLHTLTVRIGFKNGQRLYFILILFAFLFLYPFYSNGLAHWLPIFIIPLSIALIAIKKLLDLPVKNSDFPPFTGKLYMIFGLTLLISLL